MQAPPQRGRGLCGHVADAVASQYLHILPEVVAGLRLA